MPPRLRPTPSQLSGVHPPVPGELDDSEKKDMQLAEMQSRIDTLNSQIDGLRKRSKEEGRALLQAAIDKYGIEPVDELLRLATEKVPNPVTGEEEYVLKAELRVRILMSLAEFRIPKVKQQEVRHEHDHNFTVKIMGSFGSKVDDAIDVTPRKPVSALR